MQIQSPYTVHEAEVGVFHAWGDGIAVAGPTPRHLQAPAGGKFSAGLRMTQSVDEGMEADAFEWRKHRQAQVMPGDWLVEMTSPLGAMTDEGVQVASLMPPGMPVVVVVRFKCRVTGLWRVFQFHDAVALPVEVGEDGQRAQRTIRFSAGFREEFKSGLMPELVPRLRGVIEWRHLGRVVRCWEYDPEADAWAEDAENGITMEGQAVRHVTLDFTGGGMALGMLAAVTEAMELGGMPAVGIGWADVWVFGVAAGSSGLTLQPGWQLEAAGIAEPLLLPPSGRHWEHPRVVFRVLGRTYATAAAGVFALPALEAGRAESPIDLPIRLGRLVLYPEGGRLLEE